MAQNEERTNTELVSGAHGTMIVNDATEVTETIFSIVVLEDTVFNTLKIKGVDVIDDYVTTKATAVKAGALIRPRNHAVFSGVDLTSGSVEIVL